MKGCVILLKEEETNKLLLAAENNETIIFKDKNEALEWVKNQRGRSFSSKTVSLRGIYENG